MLNTKLIKGYSFVSVFCAIPLIFSLSLVSNAAQARGDCLYAAVKINDCGNITKEMVQKRQKLNGIGCGGWHDKDAYKCTSKGHKAGDTRCVRSNKLCKRYLL